jgi:hypothetical protein
LPYFGLIDENDATTFHVSPHLTGSRAGFPGGCNRAVCSVPVARKLAAK